MDNNKEYISILEKILFIIIIIFLLIIYSSYSNYKQDKKVNNNYNVSDSLNYEGKILYDVITHSENYRNVYFTGASTYKWVTTNDPWFYVLHYDVVDKNGNLYGKLVSIYGADVYRNINVDHPILVLENYRFTFYVPETFEWGQRFELSELEFIQKGIKKD